MSYKTSVDHPILIAEIRLEPPLRGRVGLTLCPGKHQDNAVSGAWRRDLDIDLDKIRQEGWTHVISLVETQEMRELNVTDLGPAIRHRGMTWCHFPIPDGHPPSEETWPQLRELRSLWQTWLGEDHSVLVHCKGGLGRAGTISAILLMDSGHALDAGQAITQVRAVRRHAIDPWQEDYLRELEPLA